MLPIDLKHEELKPGDIIFVSADYNNKKVLNDSKSFN